MKYKILAGIPSEYYNPQKSNRFGQGLAAEMSVSFARSRQK